ncbi:TonB-dependent receptor plug domain-containing protein [Mucilaginibacter mali]|uniref:TonB-dependent receptor plug domain-containing protein n=1 Tax=Mucilaginibacter mali TaxID=2740462 RepID=A0A7D4ULA9_9SPHI|nr:TonB-dependent receptor plug domain-containing protein [Mucilaginibacter mali]QKJ29561.1 TonB-dependent receptor plug domain-containing protein [Mucilaginibacter mali]
MKTFTICVKLLTALSIVILSAFSPADDLLDALLAKIEKRAADYPQEKIHLQLDKPYYSIGEDMWFKAYIVDARQNYLSVQSKILYVDLIDSRDSVRQTLLLPVENGLARGNMYLSDSLLSAGNYRICAYTKWMANFSSEYFFTQHISIVNALKSTGSSSLDNNRKPVSAADIQFFAEGGHLVTGIRTKIGFKALKPDGFGEDVSGYVIADGSSEHVAEFKSGHAGMGIFALAPAVGKNYAAVIKHADGVEKRYPLPTAEASGYVLNVNHTGKDSLSIRVSASPDLLNSREAVVIAQCNGVVQFAAKVKLDKASNTSYVSAKNFRTGIVQFTLFSPDYLPVAERLVFIDHGSTINADIKADKAEYAKRGKVALDIAVKNALDEPVTGSFSVAVTDAGKVITDEDSGNSILTNLLLTSDIKGHIEQPGYYFNPANPDRLKHLDQLLLTQGWRRFSWADLQANKFPTIKYPHEQSLTVSGRILTLGNKPVPNGKVMLFAKSADGPLILDTVADEKGHFVFNNLYLADTAKVVVKATKANNGTQVKTVIDPKPRFARLQANGNMQINNTGLALDNYLKQTRGQFAELNKLGLTKGNTLLKEVAVKGLRDRDKFVKAKMIPNSANLDPGSADYVLKQEQLEKETYFSDAMRRIPGIDIVEGKTGIDIYSVRASGTSFSRTDEKRRSMLIVIDGAQLDALSAPPVLKALNPQDLTGVEVLTGLGKTIYGEAGNKGVIIITTKRGGENDAPNLVFNINHNLSQGYSTVKEFYSPNYDTPNDQTNKADLRSTIYWNPDVVTGADGKANISFYNADGTGSYRVTLEGMDTKGGLVRKTFTYIVK